MFLKENKILPLTERDDVVLLTVSFVLSVMSDLQTCIDNS